MSKHKVQAAQRMRASLRRQAGSSLIESMAAIVIMSFGVLGIARFQTAMLMQSMDAQSRLAASALAEELLSMVHIDTNNAACYTLPAQGVCASPFATAQASAWATRATASIPGILGYVATMPDAGRFTVRLSWSSKAFKEPRYLEVDTDARP